MGRVKRVMVWGMWCNISLYHYHFIT